MVTSGKIIALLGWIFLIYGVGLNVGLADYRVFNLHLATIANNIINLGYFLVLIGVLKEGFRLLQPSAAKPHSEVREKTEKKVVTATAIPAAVRVDPSL